MNIVSPDELARLLDQYGAALELYAAQWCTAPSDVVQESFLQLVQQSQRPEHLVAWLYRAVRNRAVSAARSASRRQRYEMAAAGQSKDWFEPVMGTTLDARRAAEALAELPEGQREVIVARVWGGLSFEQIAEIAGVTSSTAHRRYEAGLAALRERLGLSWLNEMNSKNR